MKVLVIFGSSSDEYIYSSLIEKLETFNQVSFEIISAHRDPVLLEERLNKKDFDYIIAGAGLAAHLPGVVASKVEVPVFGVPVEAAFGGIDALFSIQQMPFGIPVAACGPGKSKNIVSFMDAAKNVDNSFFKNINLVTNDYVINYEYVNHELNRTKEFAKDNSLNLTQSFFPKDDCFNIHLVTQKDEVSNDPLSMNVPLLDKLFLDNPYKIADIFDWVMAGGLWVGTNNTRNALIFALKMSNRGNV